ncbi:N-methyl-L-tryptophan oxidase [Blastococcus sp. CT_GayMR16]|nr:N-methyl-L-tryptophan oxidase [Blastococcus sp. CT_GayMR16]
MGSAAAAHLAGRGARVLGLERFGPAHALGSSHGGSRIIRQAYFEDPAYVPLLRRAYELWEQLEVDSGRGLMTQTGGLYLGRPESPTVAGSLSAAQEWDLPHEVLDAAEIRRRFPTMAPADDEVGLYEEIAGFVRPEETVTAHLELAGRRGAELRFAEPALAWTADGGGVRVTTASSTYAADHLVICPGAWAPELLADLGLPLTVERQVMYWFQPDGGVAPFVPDRQPIWIHGGPELQLYGFPAIDGQSGGVKAAFFRRGEVCTPETIDREVHPEEVEFIAAHLRALLPTMPNRLLSAVTCMYTTTPDHHFVIAGHPQHAQVTVACGFSGHGFKFVPVVGEILADLALSGATDHPIALFDPGRPAMTRPRRKVVPDMTMPLDLAPQAAEVARVVAGVRDDQLADPTPCADTSVAALLHHLVTLTVAFRGAAEKEPQAPGPYPDADQLPPDWRQRLPRQLDALAAAWREPSAWEGSTEIAGMTMPGPTVAVVALNEVLVHGWDVAAGTGQEYLADQASAQACLDFAVEIAASAPEMRNGMYGPVVLVPSDAPVLDRLLGQTGRNPSWTP